VVAVYITIHTVDGAGWVTRQDAYDTLLEVEARIGRGDEVDCVRDDVPYTAIFRLESVVALTYAPDPRN
jgi:hypothetical protein